MGVVDALDVIKRADDLARERNGIGANGNGGANGVPPIELKSHVMNANGISEAEVTALDLRLAEMELGPAPEVERVERHGTGDAYTAKLDDKDAGIEPGVGGAARSPPSRALAERGEASSPRPSCPVAGSEPARSRAARRQLKRCIDRTRRCVPYRETPTLREIWMAPISRP